MFSFFIQLIILICAYIAAVIANLLHIPLPWLIGPLLLAISFQSLNIKMPFVQFWRQGGQAIVGAGLGTYFTAAMLALLLQYAILSGSYRQV